MSGKNEHDVFLSFRGEDTRNNFTDHLYNALKKNGIYPFRDDERLERGKEISSELLKAIENSRFSIIILSKDYAASKWCLEELAKIVECWKTKKHMVFPVFYKVDPSEVRRQSGDFKKAFDKHEEDFKDNLEKVKRWRLAFTQVGELSGWCLQDRSEVRLIETIVDEISSRLNQTLSFVAEDIVGIDSRVKKICELLQLGSDDIRFIGIWGMGGIGKTTIARVVYERLSNKYEGSCFLASVREVYKKSGVLHLQERLLSDVLKEKNLNIRDDHEGINCIRHRLCQKRVFIILDDVDNPLEKLEKLAGKHDWFGLGSRIIITTRDKHVLRSHGVSSIYEVAGLEDDDALQLFGMKAFRNKQPPDAHAELSKQVVSYAKGLPYALKVLGSYLCGRTVEEWKSELNKLRQVPNKTILERLRISYDGLEELEKQIFLDIACFFKCKNKDRVIEILDYFDFYSTIGISRLVDKSLLTISYNKLGMHDLLQEMGWEIVREANRGDRGKWSRLWLFEDVYQVMDGKQGTDAVEAIMLNKSLQRITWNTKSLSNMTNLRFLNIRNVDLSEDLECLSNELRFLKWHGYPSNSLPSNFRPRYLFELHLCHSRIKSLWKGEKIFHYLKVLKLSYSHDLTETPEFLSVPNLEKLHLEGCTGLRKLHESVVFLERLIILNLKDCSQLESLPSDVGGLKLLEDFNLGGCSKLDTVPLSISELTSLKRLTLTGKSGRMRELEDMEGWMRELEALSAERVDLCVTQQILRYLFSTSLWLPPVSDLCCFLTILDLSGCRLSERALARDLGSLCFLKELNLSNNNFESLPESFREFCEKNKINVIL